MYYDDEWRQGGGTSSGVAPAGSDSGLESPGDSRGRNTSNKMNQPAYWNATCTMFVAWPFTVTVATSWPRPLRAAGKETFT